MRDTFFLPSQRIQSLQNMNVKDRRIRKKHLFFKYLTKKMTEGSKSFILFDSLASQRKCVWQKLFIVYLNSIVKTKEK